MASVIEDAFGNLYGTTWNGGGGNMWGTVFKLSPPPPGITVSANPASLTIKAGQSGTATLTITPGSGFDSAVSFTCSGLPEEASCSFSPQTVTPSGGKSATTTLTITTTAPTLAALRRAGCGPQGTYALLLPLLGLLGTARGRRTRRGPHPIGLLVLLGMVLALTSCGSNGASGGGNTGTPAGTSTVTVMAVVTGGSSQTALLSVTVTQ
jgi:hypothetical protein